VGRFPLIQTQTMPALRRPLVSVAPSPGRPAAWRLLARTVRVVALWLVTLSLVGYARAADTARKSFDLPADLIEPSLKRFSAQSGLQVLFPTDAVAGLHTAAVRGELTSRAALDRLLAGTGFEAFQDPKSGAFTVRKNPSAPAPVLAPRASASASPSTEPNKTDHAPMNPKTLAALVGTWLATTLAPASAADATVSTVRSAKEEPDVVLLSPFTVNSDTDVGYQASSTLAGTRLNTSLKDIGSSISIYTKSFLNDIGATNANELLVFGAGTEAAGSQGNYSGAAASINSGDVYASGVRTAPQNATRVRGLASPSYARGLFNTAIPIDSFNIDSVTVNRGANAILFGVGSPSGVVNTTLTQANLLRNLNKIEFRYGNNDSSRSSFDLNRVLIPRKLAMRLAAVDDDERYNQRPAFDHKRRIYGTVTAKPFTLTTLRGSFESGHTRANRPLNVLPMNSISPQWYAAGRPTENWLFYDDPALNPNAATQSAGPNFWHASIGTHQFFDQVGIVYSQTNATTPSNSFRGQLLETNATLAERVRSNLFHPLVNRDLRPESNINHTATRNIVELTRFAFPDANGVAPAFVPAGIKRQGFTDFSSFDYQHEMLDQTGGQSDSHHTYNLAFEQLAWKERLGVELAYNSERYDRRALSPFLSGGGNGQVRIDTSVTLPTGQPNPNLGRPFLISTQTGPQNTFTRMEAMRATAFARYNFNDLNPRLGRWLGRHSLTGLYERQRTDTINYFTRLVTSGAVADSTSTAADNFNRQGVIFVYLGDSILKGAPLKLNPIKIPTPAAGLTARTTYFSAPAGSTTQGDFTTATTTMYDITPSGRGVRDVLKSQAAVLQSHWLRDHVVTTLGWRRDEDFFESQVFRFVDNPTKVHRGFSDFNFAATRRRSPRKRSRATASSSTGRNISCVCPSAAKSPSLPTARKISRPPAAR
jgi:catecholate siderophore receptor